MKRLMIMIAVAAVCLTAVFSVLYHCLRIDVFLTLAITFGTISYHFVMRLFVGLLFSLFMHNEVDYHHQWFQVSSFEKRLYQKLNVKKWKNKLPTFESELFDPSIHSWDEIAQAMCQAELVHETIILLSFLPMIAGIWFGAFDVFIITSLLAALIDLLFVMLQRYNRPRVIRLIRKKEV